jgi:hypothetical protein
MGYNLIQALNSNVGTGEFWYCCSQDTEVRLDVLKMQTEPDQADVILMFCCILYTTLNIIQYPSSLSLTVKDWRPGFLFVTESLAAYDPLRLLSSKYMVCFQVWTRKPLGSKLRGELPLRLLYAFVTWYRLLLWRPHQMNTETEHRHYSPLPSLPLTLSSSPDVWKVLLSLCRCGSTVLYAIRFPQCAVANSRDTPRKLRYSWT